MRIALSMSTVNEGDTLGDGINHQWISWATANGITPVLIPNELSDLNAYVDSLSINLIVLTGTGAVEDDKRRSATERRLVEMSIKKRIPLLGTGRGMQFLNKYFGGSLETKPASNGAAHDIIFTTPWQGIYQNNTQVNSQQVKGIIETGLGKGFKIAAIDAEGYVEAIAHEEFPITGIAWRPESPLGNPRDVDLLRNINAGRQLI